VAELSFSLHWLEAIMTRFPSLFVAMLLAAVSVSACDLGEVENPDAGGGGGGGGGSGGGDGGGQTFTSMITPLVSPRCTNCHGGSTEPNLADYSKLMAKYKVKPGAQNVLVTKGDSTGGMHYGMPYFTAAEKTTVGNWIDSIKPQ
jgi:hypothetical protein